LQATDDKSIAEFEMKVINIDNDDITYQLIGQNEGIMVDKEPDLLSYVYNKDWILLSYEGPRALVPLYDLTGEEVYAIECLTAESHYHITKYVNEGKVGYFFQPKAEKENDIVGN